MREILFVTATLPEAEAIFGKSAKPWAAKQDYLVRENIVVTGMGVEAAEKGLRSALVDLSNFSAVIGVGVAGALSPRLHIGDLILPSEVRYGTSVEKPTKDLFPIASIFSEALVTVDHLVASPAEKAGLHAATGAIAVDMESAVWGRVCREKGIPWMVARSILDRADENLPTGLGGISDGFGRPRKDKLIPWLFTFGHLIWGIRIQRRMNGPATSLLKKVLHESKHKAEESNRQAVIRKAV